MRGHCDAQSFGKSGCFLEGSCTACATTNSSPPQRTTVSMPCRDSRRMRPTLMSTLSPPSCPYSPLMGFSRSRSTTISASRPPRGGLGNHLGRRVLQQAALPRPVSGSVKLASSRRRFATSNACA